jgi:hypothetical protein
MNETGPSRTERETSVLSPPAARVALSRQGEEILRAVVPVVLGPLLPAEHAARAEVLEAGLASLDDYLAHLSPPLQRETRLLFGALALLPVRLVLVRTWSRWPEAAPKRVEAFLRRAQESRFFLLRRVYTSLQSLAVIAWFDLPVAWNEIGYPGPPIERPVSAGAPS